MSIFRHTIRRSSRRERALQLDRAFEFLLKSFLVCYFLFVFSAWLSYRPAFRISQITIEGTQAVDAAAVYHIVESQLARHVLWKIDRNNALLYPERDMRTAIMALDTHVKGVVMKVRGTQITIEVNEYTPAFLWCSPESVSTTTDVMEGCAFADKTGHLFAPAPEYSGNPFIVFMTTIGKGNNSNILDQTEFSKVNTFLNKLEGIGLSPRVVRESGAHDFTVITDQPWEIRWSSERDPDADTENLTLVLQNLSGDHMSTSTLKSVDLRFGNKVFYR